MKGEPARRLFLALMPTPAARASLLRQRDDWGWAATARLEHLADLHVTLHFLGAVPASRVAALKRDLGLAFAPFRIELQRAVVWPGADVAVLEPGGGCAPLTELHMRVAERLQQLGVPHERRRYRPHLTLARRAGGSRPPRGLRTVGWRVSDYVLVESLLVGSVRPGVGRYRVLRRYRATPALSGVKGAVGPARVVPRS